LCPAIGMPSVFLLVPFLKFISFRMTVAMSDARIPMRKDVYYFRAASTTDACKNKIAY